MAKLDVDAQRARIARHEDRLPAMRQDARTLLSCARELRDIIDDDVDMRVDALIATWRARARRIEAGDEDRVPGFLGDDEEVPG